MRLAKNNGGGIEGLPLRLLVLIVVAAVGLGILIYWLNDVDDLKAIGNMYASRPYGTPKALSALYAAPADLEAEAGRQGRVFADSGGSTSVDGIYVRVFDEEENGLNGVTVTVEGAGTKGSEVTDHKNFGFIGEVDGIAYFPDF
ncbi:MAG: hypothetical protein QW728_03370, partial [Thermoplasmata archaeon]